MAQGASKDGISGPDFRAWLEIMQSQGRARSDAECGRLLKISANSVAEIKNRGADFRTALACAALLAGLGPFSAATVVQPQEG